MNNDCITVFLFFIHEKLFSDLRVPIHTYTYTYTKTLLLYNFVYLLFIYIGYEFMIVGS